MTLSLEREPATSRSLTLQRISTSAELAALRREWEGLLERVPGHSLSVTPLWMGTWWELYGDGRALCVVTARAPDGRLVGLAPMLQRRLRHRGLLPLRRLEFLATG